jgi:sigma-B regulation protein RsbU (phosphoserine phosphatase)
MQPASEVGGDFYDFLLIGEDRLAFMIGDASGKGVSAAMLATQVRTLLRSSLSGLARPAAALAFANHAVAADNPNAVFTTAVVGVLDLSTGRLTLASAGHDPPFLLRKGGVAETLSDGLGIALGMLEVAEYEDASLVLEPGDQLLLFTDGVTEALAQDDTFFGQDRLRRALPALSGLSPDRLIDRLRATLSAFMGSKELADDITMLVLDYYGAPRNGLIGEEQNDVFATAS